MLTERRGMVSFTQRIGNLSYLHYTLRHTECFRCGSRRGSHFKRLFFWAQADEFWSPDHQKNSFPPCFFCQSYSKCNSNFGILFFNLPERMEQKKKICESSDSRWLCVELFEKEVVLFLVFYLFSRCLSTAFYFIRNQSLMLQETVLFEHKVIRKEFFFSPHKKKSYEAQEIVWRKSTKIWSQLLMTCCPLVGFCCQTLVFVSHFFLVPLCCYFWNNFCSRNTVHFLFLQIHEGSEIVKSYVYNHSTKNHWLSISICCNGTHLLA